MAGMWRMGWGQSACSGVVPNGGQDLGGVVGGVRGAGLKKWDATQ